MHEASSNLELIERDPPALVLGDELRGERATLGKSLLDVQRELHIKAACIDAIENADASGFPDPAFVAGYVRSYARYLGLDPDEVYRRFCAESGFRGVNRPAAAEGALKKTARKAPANGARPGGFRPNFPMAVNRAGRLPQIPLSAIGSLLVLVALIAGLGYGGWTVLQNIQRVQFAPVDELPLAVAEVGDLAPPAVEAAELGEPPLSELASPVAATALVELYRAQELEVPILVPRDGPIAAVDPDRFGPLAAIDASSAGPAPSAAEGELLAAGVAGDSAELPQVAPHKPRMTVLAERPAWIRVYLEDGSIIFERILESGEIYEVPDDEPPPLIWAGNSGSVYVQVDKAVHGPLGPGTRAARDVVLAPAAIAARYGLVEDVPEVISETISKLVQQAEADPAVLR